MQEYQLSRDAKKILKSVIEAGLTSLSVEEISVQAGVKSSIVRKELQNEDFRSLLFEAIKGGMTNAVPSVITSLTSAAEAGSIKHQTLFLELVGMYEKKQSAKLELGITTDGVSPFKDDERRKDFALKTLNKFMGEG